MKLNNTKLLLSDGMRISALAFTTRPCHTLARLKILLLVLLSIGVRTNQIHTTSCGVQSQVHVVLGSLIDGLKLNEGLRFWIGHPFAHAYMAPANTHIGIIALVFSMG